MHLFARLFSRHAAMGACVASTAILVGCAVPPAPPAKPDAVQNEIDRLITRSGNQPGFTGSADAPARGPRMEDGKVWVSWHGDAVDLLKKLEPVTSTSVLVTGPTPRLPLYVQVSAAGIPIDEVYRDIGYQLGQRADLVLQTGRIEVRYRAYN